MATNISSKFLHCICLLGSLTALNGCQTFDRSHIIQAVNHPQRTEADKQRDINDKPSAVLDIIAIQPGMKVLDLFAGGGYYSELLSHAVGNEGSVYAHNNVAYVQWLKQETLDRRFNGRLANTTQLLTEPDDLKLPENYFDKVIMVMSYHDIYYKASSWPDIDSGKLLKQINRALTADGKLLIIDHAAAAGTGKQSVQTLHRIEKNYVIKDLENAGFKLSKSSNILHNAHDDKSISVFHKKIKGKTDRFVLVFSKI